MKFVTRLARHQAANIAMVGGWQKQIRELSITGNTALEIWKLANRYQPCLSLMEQPAYLTKLQTLEFQG